MEFMNFDTSKPKDVSINNFSKSLMTRYYTCPLWAWRSKRDLIEAEGRALSIGKASHEYFASFASQKIGQKYSPHLPYSPVVLKEAKEMASSIDLDLLTKEGEIIFIEKRVSSTLASKNNLIAIFDLVLYCSSEYFGEYINIVDYKTGFKVSKELDDEAIIYSHLAAKEFKLPVVFTRISGSSGDKWEHYFTYDEALEYEKIIDDSIIDVKKVLESEEAPFPKAGSHCIDCPFLDQCAEATYSMEELDDLITQKAIYEAKAKRANKLIKEATMEHGGIFKSEQYTSQFKEKTGKKLKVRNKETGKTKAFSKKDFIELLTEAGELDSFYEALSIEYTPEVIEKAKELGLVVEDTLSRSLDVQLNTGEICEKDED